MPVKNIVLGGILLIFGLVEVGANGFFLAHLQRSNDFSPAKSFHGDFPPPASNHEWLIKVLSMFMIGFVAVIASLLIFKANPLKTVFIYIVSGSMLCVGLLQTLIYGPKHPPAFGSLLVGLVFTALAYLLG